MKNKNLSNVFLIVIFLAGLSLLLYPTVANWWNMRTSSFAVAEYTSIIANAEVSETEKVIQEAREYNRKVYAIGNRFYPLEEEEMEEYAQQLSIGGSSMMGYLSVPKINVQLPIYHGTGEAVLSVGIGHLEGTSLPVGGSSTHTVLSGHRGLPSARLLTDLDKLVVGDVFIIETLGETLTYEVDQILIVIPAELDALTIKTGADYATLVTCTPYGINSHRLLVRGHRIKNASGEVRVTADARQIEPIYVAPFVAAPLLALLLVLLMTAPSPKRKKK